MIIAFSQVNAIFYLLIAACILFFSEEIFQFDTIRRATINMRLMSNYRYGSSSLHPGSVYSTLER